MTGGERRGLRLLGEREGRHLERPEGEEREEVFRGLQKKGNRS